MHIANGKLIMALTIARYKEGERVVPMKSGKLRIQSEATEVFYRDIEVRSIPAMPAEYEWYFRDLAGDVASIMRRTKRSGSTASLAGVTISETFKN